MIVIFGAMGTGKTEFLLNLIRLGINVAPAFTTNIKEAVPPELIFIDRACFEKECFIDRHVRRGFHIGVKEDSFRQGNAAIVNTIFLNKLYDYSKNNNIHTLFVRVVASKDNALSRIEKRDFIAQANLTNRYDSEIEEIEFELKRIHLPVIELPNNGEKYTLAIKTKEIIEKHYNDMSFKI